MKETGYYNDEKELLKVFLKSILFNKENNASYLSSLSQEEIEQRKMEMTIPRTRLDYTSLDLIVRPECNLKCEYCYIANHGDELYPKEERVDNATILSHLRSLLNYVYKKNGLYIQRFALFSGDLFYDNFIFNVLDVFYEYMEHEYKMYMQLYTQNTPWPVTIEIPTNSLFILHDDKVQRFEEYCDKFWQIGVKLFLSISTDGAYVMDTRERMNMPDDYFDKLFAFCAKHEYFFHPMVGADNIEHWIENYDWWKEKIAEYDFESRLGPGHFLPMMLEVRNDNWTKEKIGKYIAFLNYMVDDRFDMCNYDLTNFTLHLMKNGEGSTLPHISGGYDPILLINDNEKQNLLCSVQTSIHIRLNDLTIVPCHRTAYKQFEAGQFRLDPDTQKIIDIEPKNVALWLQIMNIRRETLPRCANCIIQPYCICGCLGSQYEANGEIFSPINSVCDLLFHKNTFLIYKYTSMGVFDEAKRLGCLSPRQQEYLEKIRGLDIYGQFKREFKN